MNSDQDVKDIIAQLQRLQLRQTELIRDLERLSENRDGNSSAVIVPPDVARGFAIGDQVRIRNPGLLQPVRGTIIKIGATRITVRARNGTKIVRAPKNLVLDDE
jgi:hypothetical protein